MRLPRILVAGTGSGCGKTTVTIALLRALMERGLRVAAFKCGPDYIDPMFHARITGAPARNLDAFLCGRESVTRLLAQGGAGADIAVIEGVMGLYDGMSALTDENSAADIARLTGTPAILVVNPRGTSLSAAALVHGFAAFRENTVRGVILNGISEARVGYYRDIIENSTPIRVLGCLPEVAGARLESRHLGLVTAGEIADLRERAALLGNAAAACVDLDAVVALAESAAELADAAAENFGARTFSGVRIAVARDAAFCFVYEDSLEVLRGLGAELVPFSPLADARLPEGVSGLILPGGYPELYAARLSANAAMRGAVREAVAAGLPTIAECGGFMYLLERLDGLEMAGAVPGEARMTGRLGRFGYFNMTAKRDNLLCGAGETISAHEFHYSESRAPDGAHGDFVLTKPGAAQPRGETGVGTETLYAAYPHLHFAGNAGAARRFLAKCAEYGAGR